MDTLTKFVNRNYKNPEFFVWNFWAKDGDLLGQSDSFSVKKIREKIKDAEKNYGKKVVSIEANAQDDEIIEMFDL